MTQASCEKRPDVLPGQGHGRSDRPLKKPVWQKRKCGRAGCRPGSRSGRSKKKRHACVREKSMRCERSTVCRFGRKRAADVRSRNAACILARCRWIRSTLSGCPKRVAAALHQRLQAKNASNACPAVDKPLHIHRMRCAERAFLKTVRFFSNIGASPIQSLSRALSEP